MFADIMIPLEGMGVNFRIEENIGPIIPNPMRSIADIEKLRDFDAKRDVPFVLETIRRVRIKLDETNHALVGFSGAPFTIASYLIEGQPSRDFTNTKKLMFNNREAWALLMLKISDMISTYLSAQIEAGVDAVQLFDSWIGPCQTSDYQEFVIPYVERIFKHVRGTHPDTPTIHFGTNTGHLLRLMKEKRCGDVFSVDWRIGIGEARSILGDNTAIQGNMEPAVLLASDREFIRKRTQQVLDDNGGARGHIFNLGHGILRDTPVETAKFMVDYVHGNTTAKNLRLIEK